MNWTFEDSCHWSSPSRHESETDTTYFWIITVLEDGSFSIEDSDEEILPRHWKPFKDLQSAKTFCERWEEKYS